MLRFDPKPPTQVVEASGALLRALPEWFGMEDSIVTYVRCMAQMPTWSSWEGDELRGFLSVKVHFETSAEVYVMGVAKAWHRRGIGRGLLEACEQHLRDSGIRILQVKTISPSKDDPNYAETRAYYVAMGFEPMEEFPTLWDEWNPCLQLVKVL